MEHTALFNISSDGKTGSELITALSHSHGEMKQFSFYEIKLSHELEKKNFDFFHI